MSYILDALRKSENQRRLGAPPDLNAAPSSPRPKPSRKSGWVLGAIALLIVGVIAAALLWPERPNRPGWAGGGEGPAVEPPTAEEPLVEPVPAQDEVTQTTTVDAQEAQGERRRRTVADRRSPAREIPAPAAPGDVRTPAPVIPEGERERLVESAEEAQRLISADQAAAELRAEREAGAQAATEQAELDVPARAPDPGDEAAPGRWEPERTTYLDIWELPLDVRRDVPEMNLSIHVFSAEPDQRFVLINGERRLEGNSLGSGARLVEINRSGAVIEFRDYRFLLRP